MPQVLIDLDIREGDILTVAARDYPIKAVQTYKGTSFRGTAFSRVANVTGVLSRMVAGTGGAYTRTTTVASVVCTPLDPQTVENSRREVLRTPEQLLQTYIASPNGFYKLLIEDLKK